MNTKIVKIDKDNINRNEIKELGKIISSGGLVAFPTETVYGLGANAYDADAIKNIYKAKGRPSDNPLIVHFADIESIKEAVLEITPEAKLLLSHFSPGPLTVILKKSDKIPSAITAGLDTVAVRIPSDKIAQELIRASGVPIAAPSANLSGKPSPTTPHHVIDDLMGRVDAIIDGGNCDVGLESTVIDMSKSTPLILRPGGITPSDIKKLIPNIKIDKHILKAVQENEIPKCPGMKYKHYSPDADVTVIEGRAESIKQKIDELLLSSSGKRTGVITVTNQNYNADLVINAGSTNQEYAKNLFKTLREFDKKNIDVVFAEFIYDEDFGLAVKNRLYKSAGNKVISV